MNEQEIEKLKQYVEKRFNDEGLDYKTFDILHEMDRTLNYSEAKLEIDEKIRSLLPTKQDIKEYRNDSNKYAEQANEFKEQEKKKMMQEDTRGKMFEEQANVLVVGRKRSGKSCLGWAFLKQFGEYNRKMYVYRHPRPNDLKKLPFEVNNLINLKQVSNLTDAVILIDEAQKTFPIQEKAVNSQLRNILALSAQNNICFIFVCHNSYFLNRSLFSFIDIKIIKEVTEGHWELERLFMKKLYENCSVMGNAYFFVDSDYMRGNERFEKPEWFDDKLSFAYRNEVDKDFFSKVRGKTK